MKFDKISDVMIFDMRFRKTDIEFIAKIEKKNRFIKINKHVFELFLVQKNWLHYQMRMKKNEFLTKYWIVFWLDTEAIELMWKNDRFAKKVDKISKDSRVRKMILLMMIKNLISDRITKFLIRFLLWYLDMMFSWYDVFLMI